MEKSIYEFLKSPSIQFLSLFFHFNISYNLSLNSEAKIFLFPFCLILQYLYNYSLELVNFKSSEDKNVQEQMRIVIPSLITLGIYLILLNDISKKYGMEIFTLTFLDHGELFWG